MVMGHSCPQPFVRCLFYAGDSAEAIALCVRRGGWRKEVCYRTQMVVCREGCVLVCVHRHTTCSAASHGLEKAFGAGDCVVAFFRVCVWGG